MRTSRTRRGSSTVEQRNHNPCVVGSNPSSATKDINCLADERCDAVLHGVRRRMTRISDGFHACAAATCNTDATWKLTQGSAGGARIVPRPRQRRRSPAAGRGADIRPSNETVKGRSASEPVRSAASSTCSVLPAVASRADDDLRGTFLSDTASDRVLAASWRPGRPWATVHASGRRGAALTPSVLSGTNGFP
jgi:hypothetical protein